MNITSLKGILSSNLTDSDGMPRGLEETSVISSKTLKLLCYAVASWEAAELAYNLRRQAGGAAELRITNKQVQILLKGLNG